MRRIGWGVLANLTVTGGVRPPRREAQASTSCLPSTDKDRHRHDRRDRLQTAS
eukprot:m.278506 g.278506  ORF g.278506 m.278506 type:complete len:53 (-) comp137298_c0_seq1:60-218(-)